MARPKKYEKRAVTSISLDSKVLEDALKSGIPLNEIFMKGWSIIIPSNLSGIEYRKKQLNKKVNRINDEMEELSDKNWLLVQEIKELDACQDLIGKGKEEQDKKIKKLMPEFKARFEKRPNWDGDDVETSTWWLEKGIEISYGDLIKRWDD